MEFLIPKPVELTPIRIYGRKLGVKGHHALLVFGGIGNSVIHSAKW